MPPPRRTPRRSPLRIRVGIDSGGTFTDLVALGPGIEIALKVPSTPDDPARAVEQALAQLEDRLAPLVAAHAHRSRRFELDVVHGTTVATNALLEGRGAHVVFVTNAGFEDLIEIGRQARPDLYDLFPRRPPPLVAREDRIGVAERTLFDGTRLRRPTKRELAALVRRVRSRRPEAIAIGLLHAWRNPAAELELERALRPLDVPISRSSAVAPLFREYERFSTTIANAALAPLCRDYLERLARQRPHVRFFVLQSNGGLTTARAAARTPVRFVLSGPAGGVAAAHARLKAARAGGAITLDMGGTSTDVAPAARSRSTWAGPRPTSGS
jgi:N-methylhydantoinase A